MMNMRNMQFRFQGLERPRHVYRSRRSACMDELKAAAGIENFIHVRVNVLETLKEFNAKLLAR